MSNLNKIKEEGEKEIRSNKTNFEVYGELGIGVNYKNLIDWHKKQMDKAFSLAIDEVVSEIAQYSKINDIHTKELLQIIKRLKE